MQCAPMQIAHLGMMRDRPQPLGIVGSDHPVKPNTCHGQGRRGFHPHPNATTHCSQHRSGTGDDRTLVQLARIYRYQAPTVSALHHGAPGLGCVAARTDHGDWAMGRWTLRAKINTVQRHSCAVWGGDMCTLIAPVAVVEDAHAAGREARRVSRQITDPPGSRNSTDCAIDCQKFQRGRNQSNRFLQKWIEVLEK